MTPRPFSAQVWPVIQRHKSLADEVNADRRLENEIRKENDAALLPTIDVTLDLGMLGDVTATVEYEAIPSERGDYHQAPSPAYLIVMSVKVMGVELMPFIEKLHRDTVDGIAAKVEEKLKERA